MKFRAELGDLTNLVLTKDERSWLVEVKATRDETVRMTETQARTAAREGERFLLCVVPVESGDSNPEADHVGARMRFITDIGSRVTSLCDDLGELEDKRYEITSDDSSGVQLEISPDRREFVLRVPYGRTAASLLANLPSV